MSKPKKPASRPAITKGRASLQNIGLFTLMDELLASPTAPWPEANWRPRSDAARAALYRLSKPADSLAFGREWAFIAMVGNLVLVLIEQGELADPDGLLLEAKQCLARPVDSFMNGDRLLCVSEADFLSLSFLLDDWEEAMRCLPARAMVRACRATERRVAAIDAGIPLQPTDRKVSFA